MSSHSGSCGCGKTQYQINVTITRVINCNCEVCRNINGGAFSTYAVVAIDDIQMLHGQEYLKSYKASANSEKHFCSDCGTPVFNLNENFPKICMVYYGTIDDCMDLVPMNNVYCDSELAWLGELDAIMKLSSDQPVSENSRRYLEAV